MTNPYLSWLLDHDTAMARAVQFAPRDNASETAIEYIAQLPHIDLFEPMLDLALDTNFKLDEEGYKQVFISNDFEQALNNYALEFRSSIKAFLRYSIESIQPVSIESNAAWLLLARAFGRYTARLAPTPLCKHLLYPRTDHRPPVHYYREFTAAFHGGLVNHSEHRDAWIHFFHVYAKNCLPDILAEIYGHREREKQAIASLSEAWISEADPFAIIKNSRFTHSFSHTERSVGFIRLLYDIDTSAWLAAVDQLPFPNIIEDEISRSIHGIDDENTIFQLIRDVPLLFDEHKRWSHSCAILLLYRSLINWVGFIQNKFRHIVLNDEPIGMPAVAEEAKFRLQQFEEKDALSILRKACTAVLLRSDGKDILLFFLEHYTSRCAQGLYGKKDDDWAVERETVKALALSLGEHGITPQCLEQLWKQREIATIDNFASDNFALGVYEVCEPEDRMGAGGQIIRATGLPLLLSAIKIWQYVRKDRCSTSKHETIFLWTWFEYILTGYDPGLRMLENTHNHIPAFTLCSLADVLMHHENPAQTWKATFEKLEPQRIRMCFRSSTWNWSCAGSDALNFVALVCIELNLAGYGPHDAASEYVNELHTYIFDTSWFLYLTATPSLASGRMKFLEKLLSQIIGITLMIDPIGSISTMQHMLNCIGDFPEIRDGLRVFVEGLTRKGKILPNIADKLSSIIQ